MTRARRLRRRAKLSPGIDARHRRQRAVPRRRSARRAVPPTSPGQQAAGQPPLLPVIGPRFLRPEPSTPTPPLAPGSPPATSPDGTTR
jgi:hypothetical protein